MLNASLKLNSQNQFLIIVFLLSTYMVSSQRFAIENEKFYIEILRANITDIFNTSSSMKLKSKTFNTAHIQLHMSTSNGDYALFNINKFSLVDESNKLRIRPIDVAQRMATRQLSFPRLATEPMTIKHPEIEEDISVPDAFNFYDFQGYELLEIPMEFSSWGNKASQVLYFRPGMFKKRKLDFYFPFPKSSSIGVLYYGDEKVAIVVFR